MDYAHKGLRFDNFSNGPVQYYVFHGLRKVGYIRLKRGRLTLECNNEVIYTKWFDEEKNKFENKDEELKYLKLLGDLIAQEVKGRKKV